MDSSAAAATVGWDLGSVTSHKALSFSPQSELDDLEGFFWGCYFIIYGLEGIESMEGFRSCKQINAFEAEITSKAQSSFYPW